MPSYIYISLYINNLQLKNKTHWPRGIIKNRQKRIKKTGKINKNE